MYKSLGTKKIKMWNTVSVILHFTGLPWVIEYTIKKVTKNEPKLYSIWIVI